jgi:hypothetical protein
VLSGEVELNENTYALVTRDEDKPNLAIIPLSTDGLTATFLPDPKNRGLAEIYPAHLLQHRTSGVGEQMRATLLLPLRPGEGNPVIKVSTRDEGSYSINLDDGHRLLIDIEPDDDGTIRVTEQGGVGRTVIAGTSPMAIPTKVHLRCREPTHLDNYEQLRARKR